MKVFLEKNKTILGFFASFFICYSIYKMEYVESFYSLFSVLIFFSFYYFFINQTFSFNKKQNVFIFITSFLFSILYVLGNIVLKNMYNNDVDILKLFLTFSNILLIISYFILFSTSLNHIFNIVLNYKSGEVSKLSSKKIFIFSFFIIFFSWLPYFLNYFPGSLTPDSITQISEVLSNNFHDHHPVVHSLLISSIFTPLYSITSNMNIAVGGYIIFQMIIMAIMLSFSIVFLNIKKVSKKILVIVLLYYSLSPIFGYFSITVWKDVIFGGIFLIFSIFILNLIDKKGNLKIKDFIFFVLLSLLFVFFRNNAIYIYIFILPFFILSFKNYRKQFIGSFIITIAFFFAIKTFIFPILGILTSSSSEYIGIPLQQIGRMTHKDVNFTKEEKKLIDDLMPIEKMKKAYNPYVSDGIKFNPDFNIDPFNKNKFEYLKLYLNLIIKYPSIATESYLISTVGYWYPNFNNWAVAKDVFKHGEKEVKISRHSLLNNKLDNFFDKLESRELPIIGMQWSIGLCFWLILISYIILIVTNQKKYILVYSLVLGLWITMMIASPVQGEFRYVFSAFTTAPIYFLLPIIGKEIKSKEKKIK